MPAEIFSRNLEASSGSRGFGPWGLAAGNGHRVDGVGSSTLPVQSEGTMVDQPILHSLSEYLMLAGVRGPHVRHSSSRVRRNDIVRGIEIRYPFGGCHDPSGSSALEGPFSPPLSAYRRDNYPSSNRYPIPHIALGILDAMFAVKGGDRVGHWGGGIVYHRHERLTSVDQTEGRQWRSRNGQRCQRVMRCPGLRELGARRSRGCA